MYVSIYVYRLALQKVCIGRQSPVQPHRRARSAGIKKAANEMSLNRSAHSQTNRYILSPFCEVLLCKAMRRRPAARGKYLKGGETWHQKMFVPAPLLLHLPIQHAGSCPVKPILFEPLAIVALENLKLNFAFFMSTRFHKHFRFLFSAFSFSP